MDNPLLGAMGIPGMPSGGMPPQDMSTMQQGLSSPGASNMPTCPMCGQAMPMPDNMAGGMPSPGLPPEQMGLNPMGQGQPQMDPMLLQAIMQGGM